MSQTGESMRFQSVQELLAMPDRVPQTGDCWGDWVLNTEYKTLTFKPHGYEVDLSGMKKNRAEVNDWILHLNEKSWVTADVLGNFIKALIDLRCFKRGA